MAMLKFLLTIALLAMSPEPSCTTQSERQIQIPALKRIAQLGYLYDEKTDNVINVGVFRRQIPAEHLVETQSPSKNTVAAITDSIEKQFKLFSIDDSAAVNLLTGITTARGAVAGIVNGRNQKSQPSGTLLYRYETMVQSIETCHDELKPFYNKDILGHIEATHVVTSITWGVTVAVTLDGSLIKNQRDTRKIQNSLNKELRSLKGKLTPSDEIESNFSMSITSDIPLEIEMPTTAKEVKEILSQIPTLIAGINQGKGIPQEYTLTPLNFIRKHMGVIQQNTTAHKINEFTLGEIMDAFQNLRSAEDRIDEIKKQINSHQNCVPSQTTATINTVFSNFQNFKKNFTTALKQSVINVQSGLKEDSILSDLLEQYSQSDFNVENLNRQFEHVLSSKLIKIEFCNTLQNEYGQLEYIGAGDDLLTKLTTLQKSINTVYILFTNLELMQNQPEKYTETFNLLSEKLEQETQTCLFVDCDLSNSTFCSNLNYTGIFKYANGTFNPSLLKRAAEEKSEILVLKEIIGDIQRNLSSNLNFTSILTQKLECVTNPCLNYGKCSFKNDERHCECSAGFLGNNCETNVDDCAGHNNCINGGTCVDGDNSFTCDCAQGFTGNLCEINIDDCAGHNNCINGGTCVDGDNSFTCDCAQGFTGNLCEINIDDCAGHNSCINSGTCVDDINKFHCVCAEGFNGSYCEYNIDDCAGHHRCRNGGRCIDDVNSFSCVCLEGFTGNHCEHINECVYPGTCASVGRDSKCKCREGYDPDPQDSRRCEPVNKNLNENATLIFGSSRSIDQFSLKQGTVTRIQNSISTHYALDFLYRTNTVFWSGGATMINTAPIRPGASKTVILNDAGASFLAFAVDWVYSHLYFSDDSRDTISVANLDGSMKKVLFTTGVTHTWAIVVDPLRGWIYWVDFTAKNIERSEMDGSGREVIANSPKNPLGLALDLTQNRLYWTTLYHPASIHSMNVDGSDKKLVFQATQPTFPDSQFWSITTFGDFVYWRDQPTKAVYKTNKCGGGEATAIHSVTYSSDYYRTLQAYHFSKQPEGVNYCLNRIGGQCSHLCFPTPSNGNVSVATKCACPDGRTLSSNLQTCT